jgi:hypothetical protein
VIVRFKRVLMATVLVAFAGSLAGSLAGCENFDLDKLDVFNLNEKKKLPGERRPLFPEGVPGVTQGVPPDLVKGAQKPPEPDVAVAEPAKPVEAEKPKPAPKPKVERRPTRMTVQPDNAHEPAASSPPAQQPAQAQQQTGTNAPWPSTAQQPAASPWPASPPPGTFQR